MNSEQGGYARRESYIAEVRKNEELARTNPKAYLASVKNLVRLGYAYYILLIMIGLVGVGLSAYMIYLKPSLLTIKIMIIVLPVLYLLFKSIFFKLEPPEGIPVPPVASPELWQMVNDIQKRLKAPRIHRIILTTDYNASASQTPRFGVLGPTVNTLTLGLPYLLGNSVEEVRSTIAHELGHFSGNHVKFGGKVYRIMDALDSVYYRTGGFGDVLLTKFLKFYMPKLSAVSFALRRQNEFEADATATEIAGKQANIDGLLRYGSFAAAFKRFGQSLRLEQVQSAEPPDDYCQRFENEVSSGVTVEEALDGIQKVLKETTSYDDTHPSTLERIRAIDPQFDPSGLDQLSETAARLAKPISPTAAAQLLGETLQPYMSVLSALWQKEMEQGWALKHAELSGSNIVDIDLDDPEQLAQKPVEELEKQAIAIGKIKGFDSTAPVYDAILSRNPNHGLSNLAVGYHKLESGDIDGGIRHLEIASQDEEHNTIALQALLEHYEKVGNRDGAAAVYGRLEQIEQKENALLTEYNNISSATNFVPWDDVPKSTLDQVNQAAQKYVEIQKVYALRLVPKSDPNRMVECLLVVSKYPWYQFVGEASHQKLCDKLASNFDCWILSGSGNGEFLEKKARSMPQTLIFWRGELSSKDR